MLYWLTYSYDREGNLVLRRVQSETRPPNAIDHGARDENGLLAIMATHLIFSENGVTMLDESKIDHSPSRAERIRLAYAIEPLLASLVGVALILGGINLALVVALLAHLIAI